MKIPLIATACLLMLTGCGEDVARQIGTQDDGRAVYQVFAKTYVRNGTELEDIRDTAVDRNQRRMDMRDMAMKVCPGRYTTLGPSELSSSAWHRGENGSPFNVELRETQSIVCISTS